MSEKKTLHIIPHSHWDREWYMPFEGHRVYLVKLFDTLIDLMEKNPAYTYYHMDGQFIVIEDYLEVRPEMKDRLLALVKANRIQVGPWYILQDEYLTSGEANVRNMLYGIRLCRRFGAEPVMTGYYPDAFGNISQSPQILAGFGIDNAVFGRGLNDIGSDNQVVKQNGITASELLWQSPDGSEVIGVMFANWYNNASELPTDPEALAERIRRITASTSRFSVTGELLGMNGCDHQPVQTNLSEVIDLANRVQDDVTVVQDNFKDYIETTRAYRDKLKPFRGEIAGQLTSGNCLLINTASCRVDIKQMNQKAQNLLERIAEPINAYTHLWGDVYDRDYYLYAWRKLMQNHPHDSICSCSHDKIYEEMKVRFDKSMQVGESMRKKSADYLAAHTDTSAGADKNILVFTAEPGWQPMTVETYVDFPLEQKVGGIRILDIDGCEVPAVVKHLGRTFTYTLPDDRFRQPTFVDRFAVTLLIPADGAVGTRMYRVIPTEKQQERKAKVFCDGKVLENEYLRITFAENGSFMMENKRDGRAFGPCNLFEDTKDGGNTYNYAPVDGDTALTTENAKAELSYSEDAVSASVTASLVLGDETIRTVVTLYEGASRAEIRTTVDNRGENHRIRALFCNDVKTEKVYAAGQFDVVERDITPWEHWTCPYNTQRAEQFVLLKDEQGGFITAHRGLNEYEVLHDGKNTLALTLLRCVGEIGDWGDFPTPLAQCKGEYTLEYALMPFADNEDAARSDAYQFCSHAVTAIQADRHEGTIPAEQLLVRADDPVCFSACKLAEDDEDIVLRLYSTADEERKIRLSFGGMVKSVSVSALDERRGEALPLTDHRTALTIPAKKIVTLRLQVK